MTVAVRPAVAIALTAGLAIICAGTATGSTPRITHRSAWAAIPGVADSGVTRFIERARAATARYRDRDLAISDGYRQIGPDFPGMGTHFINMGVLLGARLDPARPAVLEYVDVGGWPALAGVAYIRPLVAGESAPTFPFPGAWHEHTGSVDEESLMLDHATMAHHGMGSEDTRARIVMMHAWIWLDNPAGFFATDNWALPFVRAGYGVPAAPDPSAAKALALTRGGDAFYEAALDAVARPSIADSARIAAAVAGARDGAAAAVRRHPPPTADAALVRELSGIWRAMWHTLDTTVSGSEVRARIAPLATP